jgi:hypothetical protein
MTVCCDACSDDCQTFGLWLGFQGSSHRRELLADRRPIAFADRDLIRTVARRGYQFIGATRMLPAGYIGRAAPQLRGSPAKPVRTLTNLREPVCKLIGLHTRPGSSACPC